ncbi:MAG: CHRD domain-containing protein [Dehalococcoidia bacterium]|nr:CHRD domain-containing protein [Dehalococcoidia bacterium]
MRRLTARRLLAGIVTAAVMGGGILGTAWHERAALAADGTVTWQLNTAANTTVNVGEKVTWTWGDALPHSVTSVTGPATFDSGIDTGVGSTFSFTFTQAGTYTYRCNVHPATMTGTVTVQAATTTPAATATTPAATATTPAATATTPAATATTPAATATTPAATATTPPATTPTTPLAGASAITLTGSEEVPPVTTAATGRFEWKVAGSTVQYRLTASGTNMTMAHLHLAAKGANGPIVVTLFAPVSPGISSIDVAGTIAEANLSGAFAGKMSEFLEAIRTGNLYVNVHSTDHPAGLIRGQVVASPAAPSTGSGVATDKDRVATSVALAIGLLAVAGLAGIGGHAMTKRNRR